MIDQNLKNKLRPGKKLYNNLRDALKRRLQMSQQAMSKRYEALAKAEERFGAYLPTKTNDALRKQDREQSGTMGYTTIEIPYSYATVMAAHTYISSVFLSRSPVMQIQGRHGESEEQLLAMEAMLDYQLQVGQMSVPLFLWLFDPLKYGMGIISPYWDKEYVRRRETVKQPKTFLGMPLPGTEQEITRVVETPGYQGNKLFNVRPQDFFPDTRVALWNFQRGEFVGRYVEIPWHEILAGERAGRYINVDVLKENLRKSAQSADAGANGVTRDQGGRNTELPDADGDLSWYEDDTLAPMVKGHELLVRVEPSAWGLGTESACELWAFTITTDDTILEAAPLGTLSTRFPMELIEFEPEAYSLFAPGLMERQQPLNDVMSWLFNVHMYNVRASINNQFIVDPSMVVMKDFENPAPGKLLRLKPEAYGRDVRAALTQLQVADVTRANIGDSQFVMDMLQRVAGVNDSIMGMIQQGGRRTAAEVRTSTSFGISRLKTVCEFISYQGFTPLVQQLIQQTQLSYDTTLKLRVAGDTAAFAPQILNVDPQAIAGFYDFVPVDGTLPIDRFALVQSWNGLLQTMGSNPALLAQYDMGKIFGWIAKLAGIRNLQQMKFNVQVRPDEQLAMQAQAGNVVPMKPPTGLPPQMPGMGQAG